MAELRPGDVVDQRLRVSRLIGVGGMASVFEVQDIGTGQRYAMKVLHRQLLLHPVIPKRFLREAQAACTLDTPYAVKVEGTGNLVDGTPYIVMEYLQGKSLSEVIAQHGGPFEPDRVLCLADQVAQGIQDAHQRGVIHRDLKPENIFVISSAQGEHVKVVDFGISKIFAGEDGVKLTQTGVTVGTPQYMPVEQLRGAKDLDGRVDVYALGIVMFEMFAGVRPYDGFTYEEVILKVASTTAPSLSKFRPDLPSGLVQVVDRAMAKDRDARIGSMTQLRQEIAPFWSGGLSLSLSHTGGLPRATAGRTQVLVSSEPGSCPARTLPDHAAIPDPGMMSPSFTAPQAPLATSSVSSREKSTSGPSKTLVLLLFIVAAGLVGLLLAVGLLALYLLV